MGHSRKHPYHPNGGNRKLTPLHPSDVLIHLLLSETIFSPLPLGMAEISSVGGVGISFLEQPNESMCCHMRQGKQKIEDVDTISCRHARREKSTDVGKM
jgi:hypothetical protein